jgi:hypothetical protein
MEDALLVRLLVHGMWAAVTVVSVSKLCHTIRPTPASVESAASGDSHEIPEDLMALAMSHREPWAQEDTLRVIAERYDDLKDWNRVRAAMNVGRIDG